MRVHGALLSGLLGLLLFPCACKRQTSPVTSQTAVLRFENLSPDVSLDWMGRAFSEILSAELEGGPERHLIEWSSLHAFDRALGKGPSDAPGISSERTEALGAGAHDILYGDFSVVNGMLRASVTEEDVVTGRMDRVISASGPVAEGVLPVAGALARQLGDAHPFGTRNPQALRAYVAALDAPDPAAAQAGFSQATAADPDFGRAYVQWFNSALARRDRTQAERVLEQARSHIAGFSGLERARLESGAAMLSGNLEARLQAETSLARLDPGNPNAHRALAEILSSMRRFDEALAEFRRTLSLRPDDVLALNSMGYAAAYAGDLPTAIRVLRGYEALRPNEPNPLDSLGDVHFVLGHYGEAEQFYLAAHAKASGFLNGGELLKAAQARLMTGDIKGATGLFERFTNEREAAHDPFAAYHAAAWTWLTGGRREAIARIDGIARADAGGALRQIASQANAQAAVWELELGDRDGARDHAHRAVALAVPATAGVAALVEYLAAPESTAAPAQGLLKDYAQAYSLLFARNFPAAAQALERIYRYPTNDPDDGLAVLLAWAYLETGQWQRAEPLLRLNPLPQAAGLPLFSSLYIPRLFFLRGTVLEKEGSQAEASRNFQMFRALSGADATIWGEEQRARTGR